MLHLRPRHMQNGTVLVVGSGGREHAIVIGLERSESVSNIHITPGNAGTGSIGTNHDIQADDLEGVCELAKAIQADLVVIGPEGPLVAGLADLIRSMGIPCFGPNASGAKIEGSKQHANELMNKLSIPTAQSMVTKDLERIQTVLSETPPPWVLKRDGLAAGKGVTVTSDVQVALEAASNAINTDGRVIIEEYMHGEEASILVLMDESGYIVLPPSQDHKRVKDGDLGPNTGGMGAYAPAPVVTEDVMSRTVDQIIKPMWQYFRGLKEPYRGCLYVGLMISNGIPRVVEFNARFGDPETQVTLPLVNSDIGLLLLSVSEGRVGQFEIDLSPLHAATVVLASEGYPGDTKIGRPIIGLNEGDDDEWTYIYHAATTKESGKYISSGGRVVSVTGISHSLEDALRKSYESIKKINLEGSHYRSDIGQRALRKR